MPIIKVKCQNCEKNYNAFIFPPNEKGKTIGWDLKKYQCPYCRSINKAIYREEIIKLDKFTERFISMKNAIQDKTLFSENKSSEKN